MGWVCTLFAPANNVFPSVRNKLYRTRLTAKRVLVVNIKRFENELELAKANELENFAIQSQEIKTSFAEYKTRVDNDICDPEIKA